ncbi:MAG TPA: hypothetical protein VM490_26695 [Armatimonadaceae bacterium]|nr:hypothetical protein [Armatimonadaceae bacterium]
MTDAPRNPGRRELLQQSPAGVTCAAGERFAPELKAYADGEVRSPLSRFAIARHVAACAACRDEIEAMRETRDQLRVAADATAGAALSPALRSRLLTAATRS